MFLKLRVKKWWVNSSFGCHSNVRFHWLTNITQKGLNAWKPETLQTTDAGNNFISLWVIHIIYCFYLGLPCTTVSVLFHEPPGYTMNNNGVWYIWQYFISPTLPAYSPHRDEHLKTLGILALTNVVFASSNWNSNSKLNEILLYNEDGRDNMMEMGVRLLSPSSPLLWAVYPGHDMATDCTQLLTYCRMSHRENGHRDVIRAPLTSSVCHG